MTRILVVVDTQITREIWEDELRGSLGGLYGSQDVRYIESSIDTPTSIQWSTKPCKGVREARGDPEQLKGELGDTEILVVHMAPVTADVMRLGKSLRLICCARGGPVNVDVRAAAEQGITVCRTVGRNAPPVADHTIGLLLTEMRHISRANGAVKDGSLFKIKDSRGSRREALLEMEDKTLGIIGLGQVGRQVAKRAKGFDLKVIAYDPYVDKAEMARYGTVKVDLEYLLKESDFVSVHARETPETFHMLGEKEFAMMKPTCYFVNTARGSIIDEVALAKTLKNKHIAGAAIDVFEEEPLRSDNPLTKLENVTITPHMAGRSEKIPVRSAKLVAATVAKYLRGEKIPSEEVVPIQDLENK